MKKLRARYKRGGFDAVWKWLTHGDDPNVSRWRKAVKWSRARLQANRKGLKRARASYQDINKEIASARAVKTAQQKKRKQARNRLRSEDLSEEQRASAEKRKENLTVQIEKSTRYIKELRKRRSRILDRKNDRLDKVNMWIRVKVVYRRRLKRAIEKAKKQGNNSQPKFEPYMANGYNWQDSNQAVRDACARWVVLDGNYTTSLARNYVPPGGSTTSFHLKGEAGDCGPSSKTQNREYERGKGNPNYLELYGPINNLWLRNGQPTSGAEGSGIENLHDSHNHIAVR